MFSLSLLFLLLYAGSFLKTTCNLGEGLIMGDLRSLMPMLSAEACAIAGQAVALSQWHDTHRFCPRWGGCPGRTCLSAKIVLPKLANKLLEITSLPRCGAETFAVETGLRRRCVLEPAHKLYPRTDPVVIMLVESPDGQRALLGRSKKSALGTAVEHPWDGSSP